ncbi:alpha/beta hydrolase [Aureimonas leprariae]|uniref:Alpha/beta fold hydrolase n=1 Tax=Plantimonas leprariae TaxID=2615207 RepID=A0A7V7PNG6_9HYPH|nr:alpha/beta hydrolase [Aureimonas leprariae]KAB0679055.1 alpha/beta fold hydrolase [Aureimonas leprariae]
MRNPIQIAVAVAMACAASACAGRPDGVLAPLASSTTVAGASDVDMLVATTREPLGDPAFLYSGERGARLSLTDLDISIPPEAARKVGEVQWPRRLPPDPARDFAILRSEPVELRDSPAWMRQHLGAKRRVLVFVHGFNNRFDDAVYRFAQIVHDANADVTPVLFTWPSRASVFDYNYDKESTNYSRDGLEAVLQALARDPNVGEVAVLAHSMGTWLAVESLRQMAIRDGRVARKIRNVMLASPDIDIDVFRKQWAELGEPRPKFTIFVSTDDRALALSRLISGNRGRVGAVDPSREPARSAIERAGIDVIDLTTVRGGDRLNHTKFAQSPEIVQLIGRRLTNQPITDSRVGVGEAIGAVAVGATQAVGQTAAAVIAAPIAVLDPTTRRNLPKAVGAAADSAGAALDPVLAASRTAGM